MVDIIKKDGTKEPFNEEKIIKACKKAAVRTLHTLTDDELTKIISAVREYCAELNEVPIEHVHNIVESVLLKVNKKVANCYRAYRNYKIDFVKMLDDVYQESQRIMYIGDKENANSDSALVSTKRSLVFNQLNKELYKKFFLTKPELQAVKDGYIYIHDMSARRDTYNCCLADISNILTGGFEMGNIWYNEPKTLDVAFDVIGDITLAMASQQYGGFTLPEVDKILKPFAEKSYKKYFDKYMELGLSFEKANEIAKKDLETDFRQGFQGWEYKFNTVASSRGDYPFITMTFGLGKTEFEQMANKIALEVRMKGQGKDGHKKPVLFPKLVFLYDKELHDDGKELHSVFEKALECSSTCMYPDFLSMTGEGYVPSIYKKYGKAISPMGCVKAEEVVTYKFNNVLYVESFERLWKRMALEFGVKLQENKKDHFIIPTNLEIYDTKEGFVKVNCLNRNTQNQWVNIKIGNRFLTCTSDHPFHTERGRVLAKDLKIDDLVTINNTQFTTEDNTMSLDKAWLLGFMLCDGCYQNYSVFASIALDTENDIQDKFIKCFKNEYGFDVHVTEQHRGKKGNYKDLRVVSDKKGNLKALIEEFSLLFGGIQKTKRHIPNIIFRSNRDIRLAFLAGMIDADGYIKKKSKKNKYPTLQIGSINRELSIQQMLLLQSLGMPSNVYVNHYNKNVSDKVCYRVETFISKELVDVLVCNKKKSNYVQMIDNIEYEQYSLKKVRSVEFFDKEDFCYDVTTVSDHFEVSGIYSHNCRAFLSPWFEKGGMHPLDESDTPVFVGRFNIGAISLHLPMILAKSREENKDFYDVLDYYLEMIRQLHIRTYEYLGDMRASINPLGFCFGGFYGGHLDFGDKIKPILKSATASFGITALNELQELYNGKSLVEDGQFALDVMEYINKKVSEFKEQDGNLYALYGTPAESLCSKQIEQFRKKYGIIKNVSDRPYVSNSFHCHVTEDISPIEKQDLEGRFWDLLNGGKIQYVRYPINYNTEAFEVLVKRAMDKGFYEGVNLSLAYCDDCGHEELEMDVCPKCGSKNLTKIDRMNGYLAYSRVHGQTRLNEGKMAEIAERKSM